MANNRMYLLCNVCCPKFDSVPPIGGFCLGKWYPSDQSYSFGDPEKYSKLDDFIHEHGHQDNESIGYGEYPLRMEYEAPQQ